MIFMGFILFHPGRYADYVARTYPADQTMEDKVWPVALTWNPKGRRCKLTPYVHWLLHMSIEGFVGQWKYINDILHVYMYIYIYTYIYIWLEINMYTHTPAYVCLVERSIHGKNYKYDSLCHDHLWKCHNLSVFHLEDGGTLNNQPDIHLI